ncbi:MAG: DNA-binding protein [Bacteroidetes bacterium]|nr:DNA-binding protein [Bacteroidota bacterium]
MVSFVLSAQEVRTILQNPPTEFDTKPNNDSIPNALVYPSKFSSVLIVRLKYQADILKELRDVVKRQSINNAVILSAIGSVTAYHFHVIHNTAFPTRNEFIRNSNVPADILSMNGYIIDGRVHAHITLSNSNTAFGGHLEEGTTVFTFAIITIGILGEDIDLRKIDDKYYR